MVRRQTQGPRERARAERCGAAPAQDVPGRQAGSAGQGRGLASESPSPVSGASVSRPSIEEAGPWPLLSGHPVTDSQAAGEAPGAPAASLRTCV